MNHHLNHIDVRARKKNVEAQKIIFNSPERGLNLIAQYGSIGVFIVMPKGWRTGPGCFSGPARLLLGLGEVGLHAGDQALRRFDALLDGVSKYD